MVGVQMNIQMFYVSDDFLGLTGHLKTHFPSMYQLFCILNNQDQPPNEDEIAVAQGCKMMDAKVASKWLQKPEKSSSNLNDMFKHQIDQTTVYSLPSVPNELCTYICLTGQSLEPG